MQQLPLLVSGSLCCCSPKTGQKKKLHIFVPSFATSYKHLCPRSHVLLALPKTVVGLKENKICPGKGAAVMTANLDYSADIAGEVEQAWSCEVNSCDWSSRHQADTTEQVFRVKKLVGRRGAPELELLAVVIVLFAPILHESLTNSNFVTNTI